MINDCSVVSQCNFFCKYVKLWSITYGNLPSFQTDRQVNRNLHSISSRTIRSTGGASFVFDAWHLSVLLYACLDKCGISRRFTMTCRPIATPPAVWIGSVPLNQETVGWGFPAIKDKKNNSWNLNVLIYLTNNKHCRNKSKTADLTNGVTIESFQFELQKFARFSSIITI